MIVGAVAFSNLSASRFPPSISALETLIQRKTSGFPTPFFSITKPSPHPISCAAGSRPSLLPPTLPLFSSPLFEITPHLRSEWQPILKGWICSAISLYCLSSAVPKIGRLPCLLSEVGPKGMVREILTLAGLACARSVACYMQQATLWEAALGTAYHFRAHVFQRLLERDLEFFEGKGYVPVGDVSYRITAEASDVADTVYALLNTAVPNTLQLVVMATQMIVISPALSLISGLVIPFMSLLIVYLGERLRKVSNEANLSVVRLSAYLNEVLSSMVVVKANNTELNESIHFQRLAHVDMVERLKKKKMKALIPQIIQVMCIGGLLVLCAGSLVVPRNTSDASNLLPFIMSLALLIEPLQMILKDERHRVLPILLKGSAQRYGENMPLVLDGLNLHIKAGEKVALIGASGGGKTTLTKLLLRFYDPLSGFIVVDNHDIKDVKLRSLRKHIVMVSQDILLFSGSVAENIGYRDSIGKVNMQQVENAARIANAHEFIRALPQGYETSIGQRGSMLSGGQKQRVAIARALYQNSSILILDEATSALDIRSELLVRQALERLMANRTVLLIAHRPETVLMADRILRLDGGKLNEVSKATFLSQHSRT